MNARPFLLSFLRGLTVHLALVCCLGGAAAAERLPAYAPPAEPNHGILRVFGAGLKGLVNEWEAAYPLTRSVYICLDKEPGRPLPPKVKDFMQFVLSEEGQEIVRRHGIYFALPPALVREQLKKLE